MVLHEHSIVQQRRVSANLFGNFTMAIEKLVEIRDVSAIGIAIWSNSITILPLSADIAILSLSDRLSLSASITISQARVTGVLTFQPHKRIGLCADLLFHARVVLKIRAERRVGLQELRVVD
jgi:hypothetical protein